MNYHIDVTEPAERDLYGVYEYISKMLKEPQAAARIYKSIRDEIRSLQELPERCAVIDEPPYNEIGVRKLLVENYIVFYIVEQDIRTVTVLRILYNRREWRNILKFEIT